MTVSPNRLVDVKLEDEDLSARRPEVQAEAESAMRDLIAENSFSPYDEETGVAYQGPFALWLKSRDNRLVLGVHAANNGPLLAEYAVPVSPFRSIIRDYFIVCDSYYEAIRTANASKVEAIDMGRRSIHNEGSELLREMLSERIALDQQTARRLFTLLTILHARLGEV